uniref:Obscurin, cytoskeletal calmodulin and titin-interacting RhoGEF b n=1 Tax=Sinocyclocheilus anshuiensis TaxID=1608454 RepID=A0A671MZ40_9TELE
MFLLYALTTTLTFIKVCCFISTESRNGSKSIWRGSTLPNSTQEAYAAVTLKVGLPETVIDRAPVFTVKPVSSRVGVGGDVTFYCHPKPQIIWRKDGVNISEGRRHVMYEDQAENFILKVLYCKQSDNGLYTCNASNLAGQTYSAVLVIVKVFGLLLYTWSFPNDKPISKQKWPDVKPPFWFTKSCISQRIS